LKTLTLHLDVELMGRVYLKMLDYDKNHGVNRLVKDMQEYEGKVIEFEPTENIRDKIDNVINKAKRVKVKRR